MKILRLHAPGDLCFYDEPTPQPRVNEQLVRVKAVGICGSDPHWFSGGEIDHAQKEVNLTTRTRMILIRGRAYRVPVCTS